MQTLHYNISIDAKPEKVWHILWNDTTYPMWTAPFSEGSRAVTTWEKGSKVLFLGSDNNGMVSEIAENIPFRYMSILHKGEMKDGVEDTTSDGVKSWAGAMENYTLEEMDGKTSLKVDMDTLEDHKEYFEKTWPKALEKVKELAEEK